MNHTLLSHHPYSLDYPLSSESEYLSGERPFSTPSQFSTSDFFHPTRKGGLASHSSPQSLAVPINSPFRHHSIQDVPLHSSPHPLLLSPPDSLSGSLPATTTATSSANHYSSSNLPRFFTSNASSAEPYSNAPAPCLPLMPFEPNMSDYGNRAQGPAPYNSYPPNSSPPIGFSGNGQIRGLPPIPLGQPYTTSQHLERPYTNYQPQHRTPWSHDPWQQSSMPVDTRSGRPHTPPFEDTKVIREVMNQRGQNVIPEIQANIPKGFFEVEGKWTCYRRNYFPVNCSFSTKQHVPDNIYYLRRDGHQLAHITQFAVSISAKTAVMNNQDSQTRGLVQHTPKRDKATESTPGKVIIQPTTPMPSSTLPPNIHNYSSPQHVSPNMILNYEPFSGGQPQSAPTNYTFERIQFQKATANNGKRRAQQQFFHVVVELWADVGRVGKPEWIEIATRQSAQMVVRGRSPGHYKDNGRRDSTTSMDPDRGTGAGGDAGGVMHSMPSMLGGHAHNNGMDWAPTGSGGSHHYGGGSYRRPAETDSPESNISNGTFTGSPPEPDAIHKQECCMASPVDTHGNPSDSHYQAGSHFDADVMGNSSRRKRPYEEDHSFTTSIFESRRPYHVDAFLPSHLDYTASQVVPVS